VSLINDALRKARQAASEHDGLRAGARAPRAYPGRGARRGAGIGAVTLVALAAALAGAAGAWWWATGRDGAAPLRPAGADGGQPAPAGSGGPAGGGEIPATAPAQLEGPATESPAGATGLSPQQPTGRALGSTIDPASDSRRAEVDAQSEPKQLPAAAHAAVGPSGASSGPPPPGGRVFMLDAELGGTTLSLGYIVFRPVRPFAEINGVDVYEGSEIEGFTVERIEADRVVLRDADGPLELRVP